MSADLLRRAAAKIRETAQAANTDKARTPYGDRDLAPVAPERWGDMVDGYLGGPVGAHAALWSPDVAELVADWLDGEAAVLESYGPFVELINATIRKDDVGPIGEIRIGKNPETGEPVMHIESTPAAVRLARRILGEDA